MQKSELKNKNLPKGWRKVRLGSLGKIITGKTPPTFDAKNFGGPYPFITIPDLKNQRYIEKTERTISEKGAKLMKNLKLPPKTVVISCLATVGEVGITIKESFTNQQINSVICDENKIVPEFLYYYFKYSKPRLLKYSGSVYTNISKSKFADFEIEIPQDISEQKRIADILSAFDEKIELNNKINKTLEEMAQAIFKEWFEENSKFKNQNAKLWKEGYLGDGVCSEIIKPGIKKFKKKKIYLATADVNRSEIVNENTKITYENRPIRANMEPVLNSIWFAKMINTYKVLFFFEGNKDDVDKYILSTGFMGIKALRDMEYYLYLYINSERFHKIKDTLVQGAVQEAITNENVKKIKILIPPKNLINNFNDKVKPLIIKIFNNKKENQTLAALRDLLLPKLMSEEIRV